MKTAMKMALAAALALATATGARAQYWQLANQVTDMATTAINAGMNYQGYADVSYLAGLGSHRADVLEVSTTQGVRCSKLFYMGLGLGVDVLFSSVPDGTPPYTGLGHGTTQTGVAIPLYSDFRFNLYGSGDSNGERTGFFIDVRLGAAFLAGNDYIQVGDGYLLNSQCFYLRPTLGLRVPLSSTNRKLALNVGVSYQLLSSSTWYCSNNSMTLNALGASVGLEW